MYYYDPYGYRQIPYQLPIDLFQQEIDRGRQFHYFRTTIDRVTPGPAVVQFLGYDANLNLVTLRIVSTNQVVSASNYDLYGWEYLGPTQPTQPKHPLCQQYPWLPGC